MKVAKLSVIACLLFGFSSLAQSGSEWMSEAAVCKKTLGKPAGCFMDVTPNGMFGNWAAKVLAVEMLNGKPTDNVRLQITWITDRSNYHCGQVIVMNASEVKDFTHRSLAMKECQ